MKHIKIFESFKVENSFDEDLKNIVTNVVDELVLDRLDSKLVWLNWNRGNYSRPVRSESSFVDKHGHKISNLKHTMTTPFMFSKYYKGAAQYRRYLTEDGMSGRVEFLIKREFFEENNDLVMDVIKEFEDRLYDLKGREELEIIQLYNDEDKDPFIQAFTYSINYKTVK